MVLETGHGSLKVVKNFGQAAKRRAEIHCTSGEGLWVRSPENFENLHLLRRNVVDSGGLGKKIGTEICVSLNITCPPPPIGRDIEESYQRA